VEDAGLGEFHAARVTGMVVVVAGEVQGAMNHEVCQMVGGAAAGGGGLAADDAERQQHFGGRGGVGQHVGGLVAVAMARVQAADGAVGGQNNGGMGAGGVGGAGGHGFGTRNQPTPGWVGYDDADCVLEPRLRGATTCSGVHGLFAGCLSRLVAVAATAGLAPLVPFRRGTLIIRVNDAGDQRMSHDVAGAHADDGDAGDAL